MKCDTCGTETNSNHGDKYSILCKECLSSEDGKKHKIQRQGDEGNSGNWLGVLGVISILIGFFFLIFSPTTTMSKVGMELGIVNLHDLFIGSSLTIVGAIFIAAQWRPR